MKFTQMKLHWPFSDNFHFPQTNQVHVGETARKKQAVDPAASNNETNSAVSVDLIHVEYDEEW